MIIVGLIGLVVFFVFVSALNSNIKNATKGVSWLTDQVNKANKALDDKAAPK